MDALFDEKAYFRKKKNYKKKNCQLSKKDMLKNMECLSKYKNHIFIKLTTNAKIVMINLVKYKRS